ARTAPVSPAVGADLSMRGGRTWDGAMTLVRTVVCSCLLALAMAGASDVPAHAGDGSWLWPLGDHRVTGTFDPPDTEYSAGHRGIDLPGQVGEPVRAVASGRVTFAGSVAGVG